MCKIIKYLDYARLNTLEKLYFDLTIMLIVTFLSFLFLVFEFFIYENIAVFFQDCFLMSVIFIIGITGLFRTCKGLRKYKEILKSNKREEFI
ncbi:hypothetical protein ACX9LR_09065 [Campylobacter jejuni]|uniref:hypothetical protein n=1 Tax=Campylobacter coli TaxID=195 RepID=UPI0008753F42|nr:hypothetical protein [Campylobacter coli]EAI6044885.1 hypothetical protein [Campylobacter jejuni]EAH6045427.1 hypothetical protein [Campylobacter coli]ECL7730377.1 hypothetical protein [Campylobacter jejuni]ECO2601100.1 hypothetical protein [Campylobacter coli]ECP7478565.1 hypothetical protein [Campylobacter jejuni]